MEIMEYVKFKTVSDKAIQQHRISKESQKDTIKDTDDSLAQLRENLIDGS